MLKKPSYDSTLNMALTYYLNTISINKKSYKTEIYRMRPLHNSLGHKRLNELMPVDIVEYRDMRLGAAHPKISGKTLKGATVKLELMLLSHLFNIAIREWGMNELTNPVQIIRKPKVAPGRSRRLTPAEERKLLKASFNNQNPEFYAIVVLALETAMRQGEILSLMWEDIDWQKRTVFLPITKNGDSRAVPLSIKAYSILKDHLVPRQSGKVFSYTSSGIKSTWRDCIKSLKIVDLHFHDLRHCAISSLLERGLNTIEVATISGHKSMAMLKRYAHLQSHKLVDKLDPKKGRRKEIISCRDQLKAYPAIISRYSKKIVVDFPDFHDLRIEGKDEKKVIAQARNDLLRKLVTSFYRGVEIPPPSSVDSIELPKRRIAVIERISPI